MLVFLGTLYLLARNIIPLLGNTSIQFINVLMPAVIIIAGMLIMMSALGLRMNNGMGTTIFGILLNAFGWIIRQLFAAVGWFFRRLPALYQYFYGIARGFGLSDPWSRVVAGLLTLL